MFSNQVTICQISFEIFDVKQIYTQEKSKYSSLPNRSAARNKLGEGKDEPFFISVVSGISMVVRIFRQLQ